MNVDSFAKGKSSIVPGKSSLCLVKVVCLVVSHSYRLFRLNSESGKVSELVWLLWAELEK